MTRKVLVVFPDGKEERFDVPDNMAHETFEAYIIKTYPQYKAQIDKVKVYVYDVTPDEASGITHAEPAPTVQPQFKQAVEKLKQAYKAEFGKELPITSQERTYQQQKDLYNRWLNKDPNVYIPINPDDPKYKGRKDIIFHKNAIDVSKTVDPRWMEKQGWYRPIPDKDPVHWLLKGGPSTGISTIDNVSSPPSNDDGKIPKPPASNVPPPDSNLPDENNPKEAETVYWNMYKDIRPGSPTYGHLFRKKFPTQAPTAPAAN